VEELSCNGRSLVIAFYALPMRKTEVPQFGQTPLMAGLPFLSVTFWGFLISMFALHFTQYAWGISRSTGAAFILCWYNKLTQSAEIPRETASEMSGFSSSDACEAAKDNLSKNSQ